MKVCFIAHGSENIGMGHVMRSLSLAEAFRERNNEISFFSKYKLGVNEIKAQGFKIIGGIQSTRHNNKQGFCYGDNSELAKDVQNLASNSLGIFDVIVVDSYNVTKEFFIELRKHTKCLIYIDDLNAFTYPVDIILNGTASAKDMGYEKCQQAYLLLGLKYNLLRNEFRNIPQKEVHREFKNILITTGNSDPFHMTEKILKILMQEKDFDDFRYYVIIGSGFEIENKKTAKIENVSPSIFVYYNPANMCNIMLQCDFAISAGGSTLYELAACGVPTIAFAYADNQKYQSMAMEQLEVLKYIGYFDSIDEKALIEYIKYIREHFKVRKKLIKELQNMVDTKGALNVVKKVEKYIRFKKSSC